MAADSLYPIIDFDPDPIAIIEPSRVYTPADVPAHCVICFFREVIDKVASSHNASLAAVMRSENGESPIYEIAYKGKRLAFFFPGVGAPHAAGQLEESIGLGGRHFVACGGCGVLDHTLAVGHLFVIYAAVRAEGTSYHYLPPSQEVLADARVVELIEDTLKAHKVPYLRTKTWTTDAFFRETVGKVARYKAAGCLTVEMEAAAFMAVAQFRGVDFGQILYGGDVVKADGWDHRAWNKRDDIRENIFWLAADACLALED